MAVAICALNILLSSSLFLNHVLVVAAAVIVFFCVQLLVFVVVCLFQGLSVYAVCVLVRAPVVVVVVVVAVLHVVGISRALEKRSYGLSRFLGSLC